MVGSHGTPPSLAPDLATEPYAASNCRSTNGKMPPCL